MQMRFVIACSLREGSYQSLAGAVTAGRRFSGPRAAAPSPSA